MTPVTPITIVLALAALAAVLVVRPGRGLGLIIASMLLWPEYLRIPIGLAQMSVPRIAALTLIARLLVQGRAAEVRWSWIDGLVAFAWVWDLLANTLQDAGQTQMTFMIGRVFDTVCMYLAARLAIRGERDLADLYAPLAITIAVMGLVGAAEAVTSMSPYERLRVFGGPAWFEKEAEYRYGFLRAQASTSHPIYFGMVMTILTGIAYSLRGFARNRVLWLLATACGLLGALSSLSSGPQLALAILVGTSLFYYARPLIKPALAFLIVLCILVEAASNRHFYQLIDYLALNSETAWYRTRLLEVAVSHLPDYWLFGVGDKWPHTWGAEIDTRLHVDVVNHYVIVALYGGLLSLACYVAVAVAALRSSVMAAGEAPSPRLRRLGFGLSCVMIALGTASMSVGLFGPPLLVSYILLGSMVGLREAVRRTRGTDLARGPAPERALAGSITRVSAG